MYKRLLIVVSTLLLFLSVGQSLSAQVSEVELLSSWVAIDAPTGHEHLAMELIEEEYPGWERDSYGNLAKLVGRGDPLRVVACGLDSFSYAVSQITKEG